MRLTPTQLLVKALPYRLGVLMIATAFVAGTYYAIPGSLSFSLLVFFSVLITPFFQVGIVARIKEEFDFRGYILPLATGLCFATGLAASLIYIHAMSLVGAPAPLRVFFVAAFGAAVISLCLGQLFEGAAYAMRSQKNTTPPGKIYRCAVVTCSVFGLFLGALLGASGWLL